MIDINQQWAGSPGGFVKQWSAEDLATRNVSASTSKTAERTAERTAPPPPSRLFATMLYPDCDAGDPTQNGWWYDESSHTVRFDNITTTTTASATTAADTSTTTTTAAATTTTTITTTTCLDAGDGRRGALELRPCDGSAGQQFECEDTDNEGRVDERERRTSDDSTEQREGQNNERTCRLVTAPVATSSTLSSFSAALCVDANDWSGVNVFLQECITLHFGSSQVFTIATSSSSTSSSTSTLHSTGLLSSLQDDFSGGGLRRCIAALSTPTTANATGTPEEHATEAKAIQLWGKPQPGGALAVLLLNMQPHGSASVVVDIDLALDLKLEMGGGGGGTGRVRDVWAHADERLGGKTWTGRNTLAVTVNAHDSRMFVITPPSPPT